MTSGDIGPQHSGDNAFKARARLHQSRFRFEQLGLSQHRQYGNRLDPEDARAGKNFYGWPGMLEAVEERFGRKDSPLWHDMLWSGHIPFNLFVPMRDQPWAGRLFGAWLGLEVARVTRLLIEWAPEPRSEYLDDNTSFDAYVECLLVDGRRAALGIEVKYTEGAYGWGKTERPRMFDESSLYHRVHRRSELYVDDAVGGLRTRRLKQLWRNQLLGETLLQKPSVGLDAFTSVLIYPQGNVHYAKAAREYAGLLVPSRRRPFVDTTFEELIETCQRLGGSDAAVQRWLAYLTARYLIR